MNEPKFDVYTDDGETTSVYISEVDYIDVNAVWPTLVQQYDSVIIRLSK